MDELRIFERVAVRENFAAAARDLRLSPAAVTRAVAALETRLGVRLLTRTTRRCRLTGDGEAFVTRCRIILAEIDAAEEEMRARSQQTTGLLRLSAPLSFGRRHVAPLLGEFRRLNPSVTVQLCVSDASDDLSLRESDLAIRVGPAERGDFITRRLLSARRAVVAAPSYLARHGTPASPADLARHEAVALVRDGRVLDGWMFAVGERVETVRVPVVASSNSGEVVQEWALAGAGVALKSVWDVEDDLAAGRLVELLAGQSRERADLFLVYPDRRNLPARVRRFVDFLTDRLAPIGDRLLR